MARKGIGFFDSKGHFFKTPEEATISDISGLLGKIGDGESLAPGIASMLLQRREHLESLFAEHDTMMAELKKAAPAGANVAQLPRRAARG